jgi:hypothetical protein
VIQAETETVTIGQCQETPAEMPLSAPGLLLCIGTDVLIVLERNTKFSPQAGGGTPQGLAPKVRGACPAQFLCPLIIQIESITIPFSHGSQYFSPSPMRLRGVGLELHKITELFCTSL